MKSIIPRDLSLVSLSEQDLISFLKDSSPVMRAKVLHEIALRHGNSTELENMLNQAIAEEINRKDVFFGFIKVAWIPVIDILEAGNVAEIMKLKNLLKNTWTLAERKNLYDYLKNEFEVADLIA